jgi:hypothetical protein
MTDPDILAILAAYLDSEDFQEHDGTPPLSHHLLWGIFVSYTEHYLTDNIPGQKPHIPEGAPASGVTPLEAAAATTVLIGQLQGSRWWIAAEARKRGASWADVGEALGMSRQAAWEGFKKYAANPAWEPWQRMREEYRALAGDSADS